jgi:hypothetical protein
MKTPVGRVRLSPFPTNHERNIMAYLALRVGDTQTAQQLFARIGNDWDQSVWRTKALFDASRTGQAVSGTQPLRADGAVSDGANPSNGAAAPR